MTTEELNFITRLEDVLIKLFGEPISEEFWFDCESLPDISDDYPKQNKIADIVDIFNSYRQ